MYIMLDVLLNLLVAELYCDDVTNRSSWNVARKCLICYSWLWPMEVVYQWTTRFINKTGCKA